MSHLHCSFRIWSTLTLYPVSVLQLMNVFVTWPTSFLMTKRINSSLLMSFSLSTFISYSWNYQIVINIINTNLRSKISINKYTAYMADSSPVCTILSIQKQHSHIHLFTFWVKSRVGAYLIELDLDVFDVSCYQLFQSYKSLLQRPPCYHQLWNSLSHQSLWLNHLLWLATWGWPACYSSFCSRQHISISN